MAAAEQQENFAERLYQQLLQRGWSVTDIAHTLGYGDSANFTRAFRRHYGLPPSRFMREKPRN